MTMPSSLPKDLTARLVSFRGIWIHTSQLDSFNSIRFLRQQRYTPYIRACHVARQVFNLARVRLLHRLEQVLGSRGQDQLV